MTVIAVLADPPREGFVLPKLAATSPLSEAEAADLYAAMLKDVLVAAASSGGTLLVNYRSDDSIPDEFAETTDAEAAVRAVAAEALGGLDDVRFEVQVGSTFDARAGNTATHLLREEGVTSIAVVRPNAPFLLRTAIDAAAMKLRRSPVVLGPATEGRTYYAAFTDLVDFEDAFASPALETLTDRAIEAGLDVDFLPPQPTVDRGADLRTLLPLLAARRRAGRIVPQHTAAFVDELGLAVEGDAHGAGGSASDNGPLRIVREGA